jgi:signal transduction histidine kinase
MQSPLLNVIAHEAALGQCITNLLGNAVKFVLPGTLPQIKIRTEPVEGQVRIWFEDNGIGIEPSNQDRIFGIFERVHSAQEYDGTGIGLAIVRKAVERMGGSVGVESEPGNGSRFWIQLKAAETYDQTSTAGGG